ANAHDRRAITTPSICEGHNPQSVPMAWTSWPAPASASASFTSRGLFDGCPVVTMQTRITGRPSRCSRDHSQIHLFVSIGHHRIAETLLAIGAHRHAFDGIERVNCLYGFLHRVTAETVDAVAHHFRHAASVETDNGCSAGHRFYHYDAKR